MGDTALMEFADKLRTSAQNGRGRTLDGETGTFPMYTVPADVLLQMEELRAHEEMLEAGALVQFKSSMGKAMWQFPKSRGPNIDPKTVGFAVQGHPQKGPSIYGQGHVCFTPMAQRPSSRSRHRAAQGVAAGIAKHRIRRCWARV